MVPRGAQEPWTVLSLLNWTTAYFRQAGIEDPRLNAEVLLGKALGCERIMLYARFDQAVPEGPRAEFRELVRQRAARRPLQYLTGRCEFYGRQFEVTCAVMVPRPETELVVAKCLAKLTGQDQWAADAGTGSGAIAVTLAAERPTLTVVATDVSEEALEVAGRNAQRHGVADRVLRVHGDLLEPVPSLLPEGRTRVDLVASNPPYVPTAQIELLQPEVRDHEPRSALDGGPDGLDVIRRLVPQAAAVLAPGGWFVLEVGEGQADAVAALLVNSGAFGPDELERTADHGGCDRVICARGLA